MSGNQTQNTFDAKHLQKGFNGGGEGGGGV